MDSEAFKSCVTIRFMEAFHKYFVFVRNCQSCVLFTLELDSGPETCSCEANPKYCHTYKPWQLTLRIWALRLTNEVFDINDKLLVTQKIDHQSFSKLDERPICLNSDDLVLTHSHTYSHTHTHAYIHTRAYMPTHTHTFVYTCLQCCNFAFPFSTQVVKLTKNSCGRL